MTRALHGAYRARALATIALIVAALLLCRDMAVRSVWFDEAATYDFATMTWGRFWDALHHGDAFYGLYYALMHLWIAAFGASPFALRAPSLLAALATLALTWMLVRRLGGVAAAWLTAVLLTLNVVFVPYATEARPYALLMLVSVASTYLLWRATEGDEPRRWWRGYAALAIVMPYVHIFAGFVLVSHVVYLLLTRQFKNAALCAAVGFVAAIAALPMLVLAAHDENSQNSWLARPGLHTLTYILGNFAGSRMLWRFELGLGVVGAIIGYRTRKGRETTLLLCWALVPLACVFVLGHFRPDFRLTYILEMLVPYVALFGTAVFRLDRRLAYPVAALLVGMHLAALKHAQTAPYRTWQIVADAVRSDQAPIIIVPQEGYAPLQYAAPEVMSRVVYPQHFAIDTSELSEPMIRHLPAAFPHGAKLIWVIDDYNPIIPALGVGIPEFLHAVSREYLEIRHQQFENLVLSEYQHR